jgi:hypothetical protein
MRNRFDAQRSLGYTPIEEVEIPTKTRYHLANLLQTLQYIYSHPKWNKKVFTLLAEKIASDKEKTGRPGMSLWELFVLSQVRQCLNISYDHLHFMANDSELLRGILGVLPTDYSSGTHYEYQNIYDNVRLLDEELLKELNDIIVGLGHEVLKKKEDEPVRGKSDSFVVETDVHYPTDYNLLWDSARKCIDVAEKLELSGWRKSADWRRKLKRLMRAVGRASRSGGRGKRRRIQKATKAYLKKAKALEKKVGKMTTSRASAESEGWGKLDYYQKMLTKHIDLLKRRLIKGEKIPHKEKVFSIFQPYTELIIKGKRHPEVEFGKNLAITTDQYHLILDWELAEGRADSELMEGIAGRLTDKYSVQSLSVDKGFSSKEIKANLQETIPEVIMPKKGKRTKAEKVEESQPVFKKLKNKHSAVESNINEIEHRGLDRCPDRTRPGFDRYIGLAVTAYNLNRIGRALRRRRQQTARAA